MSLGLLGAYDSSSGSSSEDEDDQIEEKPVVPEKLANPFSSSTGGSASKTGSLMPKPSFMVDAVEKVSASKSMSVENSVFSNPFRVKEDKKRAILEKHVEMTVKQEELKTIGGKKVCWNFRKGRCRFGHKCSFAHDSDVKVGKSEQQQNANNEPEVQNEDSPAASGVTSHPAMTPHPVLMSQQDYEDATISADDTQGIMKRKKRPGLSNDLTPGKKAMKFYNKVYKQN